MKMTKKFLFGAAIAALVLGLASCNPEIGDIEWSGGELSTGSGSKQYNVNGQKNEADGTIRGMKRFDAIPRAGATCIVQIFDQNAKSSDGVAGFACFVSENDVNLTENGKKTMNFLVSGVRYSGNKAQTYVSYYCNVDPEKLSTKNFGVDAKKTAFDASVKTPYEIIVVKDWFDFDSKKIKLDNGTLTVAINFIGRDDGTIDIEWYSLDKKLSSGDEAAASFDPAAHGLYLGGATASTAQLGTQDGAKKGYIYAYANIYSGKTLNAQWNLYNATWSQAAFADEEPCDLPDAAGNIFFN